jgi:hypothetical protein
MLSTNSWRSAIFKALLIQIAIVGILSLVWLGYAGGADNPLWFYLATVLQFPASLLFSFVLGLITRIFPSGAQGMEMAAAVVVVLQFVLLTVGIKKVRDSWLK